MSSVSGEANAAEVGAQCFLPSFRCIPTTIKAQLELAEKSRALPRVLFGQLDDHVPLYLIVEVSPPHVVDHTDALGAALSGYVAAWLVIILKASRGGVAT